MAVFSYDEINVFDSNGSETIRSMPYEKYFGEMELSDSQIKQRIEFAKKLEDMLLLFLTLFSMVKAYSDDDAFLKTQLQQFYFEVTTQFIETDDYIKNHGEEFADNFLDATNRHNDDPWYTSEDRAVFNAENEANDILNYSDFQDAIEAGYNAKTWITMKDSKVRKTHKKVDDKTLPLAEAFEVGNSLMRFPGDDEFGADDSEIVNCRCSIKYSYNPRFPKYEEQEESE